MKNSKQHLTDAFSSLQDAQINLRHALDNSEKLNNTDNIPTPLPCPICEGNVRISFVDEDEKHAYSIIKCDYCKLSMKGNGYYLQSDNVAEARLQSLSILVNNWNDRRKKNNISIKGEI